MPAHNEEGYLEGSVRSVVAGLRQRGTDFEVIVVENGSKDATRLEARDLASALPEVRALELDVADYGSALRTGFLDAVGETVVNFDVDLVDLGFMDAALELMADPSVVIVIGSKRSPGSEDRRPAARRIVTWAFAAVLRHGFGLKASDTHGLKALRREPLVPIVERCRSGSDIFDTELVLRTERAGLSLRELPVTVSDLRPPRTAIASRIPRTLIGLGALWLSMRRDP
jgi:glycosyltransferase involved in cell wall biosynthesis